MPDFAILTRIQRGKGTDLREHLRQLPDGLGTPSPFSHSPGVTHTMRFVVVQTDVPRLLFSSRFDGSERAYLTWLAGLEAAQKVWGFCAQPGEPGEEPLRHYLLDEHSPDRLPDTYPISLIADQVTVPYVNYALQLRARLRRFAEEAEQMNVNQMAREFRALDAVRRVAEP